MNSHDVDWSYLLQGTKLALGACVMGLVALVASGSVSSDYSARYEQERAQLATLEEQRLALGERVNARQLFRQRFQELSASGVIGDEHRLEWTQGLRDSATALGLPYLRYSAMPREQLDAPYLVPGEMATVMATTMELQAGLVHELDLLRLLSMLREQVPGHFGVSGCTLERVSADAEPAADRANLNGSCSLRWFSIPLASVGMGEESEG